MSAGRRHGHSKCWTLLAGRSPPIALRQRRTIIDVALSEQLRRIAEMIESHALFRGHAKLGVRGEPDSTTILITLLACCRRNCRKSKKGALDQRSLIRFLCSKGESREFEGRSVTPEDPLQRLKIIIGPHHQGARQRALDVIQACDRLQ